MAKKGFTPYGNETDCLQIADLSIENRLDRISVYGSIDLWKDKGGLKAAREIKAVIDQIVERLEKEGLPDKVELAKAETVPNPFA